MHAPSAPSLRTQIWSVIHKGRGPSGRAYGFLSLVLILFSLAVLPLEFFPGNDEFREILLILEIVITAVFTLDYLLHVYSAPRRLHYVFSLFGIVDLLSVLPFYLGFLAIPYIRVIRLIRIARLAEVDPAGAAEEEQELQDNIGLADGETVEYIVTRHPVYLILHALPCAVAGTFGVGLLMMLSYNIVAVTLASALLLFAVLLLWRAWIDFSYDVIYVTSRRLIFQNQHLLGRSVNQVPYQAIMNIKPSYPSIISYILRYGSIVIDTASDKGGQIGLHMVRHHEHAAHIIMQRSVQANEPQPHRVGR